MCREGRTGQKAEEEEGGGEEDAALGGGDVGAVAAAWLSSPNGPV